MESSGAPASEAGAGFRVGSHEFRIVGQRELVEWARENVLGPFAAGDVLHPAATLHLASDPGESATPLIGPDGKTVGYSEPTPDGVRVACFDGNAVARGIGLAMGCAFRPPRYLMVHGAALAHGGKAVLAVGESGAGKSTLSTLVEEATLLSDELLILEDLGDRTVVHATPIHSSSPRGSTPGSGEVVALLSLVKSAEVELKPLGAAAAARLVLEQVFVAPQGEVDDYLEAATRLIARVPARSLHFRKDRACAPLVMRLLA